MNANNDRVVSIALAGHIELTNGTLVAYLNRDFRLMAVSEVALTQSKPGADGKTWARGEFTYEILLDGDIRSRKIVRAAQLNKAKVEAMRQAKVDLKDHPEIKALFEEHAAMRELVKEQPVIKGREIRISIDMWVSNDEVGHKLVYRLMPMPPTVNPDEIKEAVMPF